jgi:AmmeMemoRadiSam system protein B
MPAALRVRPPAVAGSFYPDDPRVLASLVDRLIDEARASVPADAPVPKAVIVPHAGYIYSGPIAASAYARVAGAKGRLTRVVLLGPSHREYVDGFAWPDADRLETPLGLVRAVSADVAGATTNARAHAREHSLEVHLPFLQRVLGDVEVWPLLVGNTAPDGVASVLDALWGAADTLIVISSDLSHYHPWPGAVRIDAGTADQIESLQPTLTHDQACGATPVNGLLLAAQRRRMRVERLDLRNSGDTAGGRDQVVGYGAFAFFEAAGRAS